MQRGDRLTVDVERLAYGGDGIGHAPDGRVVFMRGVSPGDRVEIELVQARKKFARGRVVERVADGGVPPFCPLVDRCGGCPWQRVAREDQRETLRAHLARSLSHATGAEVMVDLGPETLGEGWRATARMHWVDGTLGFFEDSSRRVLDVDACPVLAPPLDKVLAACRAELGLALQGKGTLRMSARPGAASGTLALTPAKVEGRKRTLAGLGRVVATGACHGGLILWPDGRIDRVGDPRNLFGVNEVDHPANAFVQAHQGGVEPLLDDVRAALKGRGPVVEYFAGSGGFTVALAADGLSVTAVEIDRDATAALEDLLARRGLTRQAKVITADAATVPAKGARAALLDPPRGGAAALMEPLDESSVKRIVYVSCDLGTLARDVGTLAARGWKVSRARVHDLFPHTGHAEAVVTLDRGQTSR